MKFESSYIIYLEPEPSTTTTNLEIAVQGTDFTYCYTKWPN